MTKSENLVVESVHELGRGKAVEQRIALYRAHARTTSRERIAAHLFACADELEATEARCNQLALDFTRTSK